VLPGTNDGTVLRRRRLGVTEFALAFGVVLCGRVVCSRISSYFCCRRLHIGQQFSTSAHVITHAISTSITISIIKYGPCMEMCGPVSSAAHI
jgi:hypothetical protein